MAESDSILEAGRRLARDLRAIRRSRSVDIKEVLDATRLADDVIEQMEKTALVGNPMFNRVYLRSMFSGYGSVLGISNADIMAALDEAISGTYFGSLAQKYLGESHGSLEESDDDGPIEVESDVEDAAIAEDEIDAKAQKEESKAPLKVEELDTNKPKNTDPEKPKKSQTSKDKKALEGDGKSEIPEALPSKTPAPFGPIIPPSSESKNTVLLPNMSGFLILVVAGLGLVALIWFAVTWALSPKIALDLEIVPTDSSQVNIQEEPDRIILPDTLTVDLIAYKEALDPIRVKVDRDLRRPYWIEHLDTLSFQMQSIIEFEREVENARILVDGYAIPSSWYASSIRAQITKERTQAWLDSLVVVGRYPPRTFGIE